MNTDRRVALYLVGGAAAVLAAGCTQQQVDDTAKKIADLINQVQRGVKTACSALGTIVPTANSVLAILISIAGANPVTATAAMVAQAIAEIVAIGCPSTPPTPTAPARTSKGVTVEFY